MGIHRHQGKYRKEDRVRPFIAEERKKRINDHSRRKHISKQRGTGLQTEVDIIARGKEQNRSDQSACIPHQPSQREKGKQEIKRKKRRREDPQAHKPGPEQSRITLEENGIERRTVVDQDESEHFLPAVQI